MADKKVLRNPIEEYFSSESGKNTKGSELFKGNDEFIDQMTELEQDKINMINSLHYTDHYLKGIFGGSFELFAPITHKYMRLMVSHQRKSRGEYVDVHRAEETRERQTFNIGGASPAMVPK